MPELPEVEVLARHLDPLLRNRLIRGMEIIRPKMLAPTTPESFRAALEGATFKSLSRRGKYLVFTLLSSSGGKFSVAGHLGMTGRMYLAKSGSPRPRHAAVVLDLSGEDFIFDDVRCFGRLTLDLASLRDLGPEPLGESFAEEYFREALKRSSQPIKTRLLDQTLVAGVGNIYASEALFVAGVSPRKASSRLTRREAARLRDAIRKVLEEAIRFGSAVSLDWAGTESRDGLFYYGTSGSATVNQTERFQVYGREGEACIVCGGVIKRIVQAARSTFLCPACQKG